MNMEPVANIENTAPATVDAINGAVRREREDQVLRLILARPEIRNPLSHEAIAGLLAGLDEAAQDNDIRVVVIASTGPVFSAGHDLKEMQARRGDPDRGHAFFKDLFARCSRLMTTIVRHPRPVIAEVNGIATAAGCQLVASCDLAFASESARFATPGVRIGLFCSTPMVALSRAVPRKQAMHMLLTGEMIDAATATDIGLINRAVPAETLSAETMAVARRLAKSSGRVLKVGKEAFQAQLDLPLDEAYAHTSEVMSRNMLDDDANEGISAFLDKRKPLWPSEGPVAPPVVSPSVPPGVPHVNHNAYPDACLARILRDVKTIAVVGASDNPVRPSYFVQHYLLRRGYRVIPVNPGRAGETILGQTVHASLADIPEPIDMVDIFRHSRDVPPIVDAAIALKQRPEYIWMQLGVRHDEAARRAEAAGIQVVMDRCPKIEFGRLSGEINWIGFNRQSISSRKPRLGARFQSRDLLGRSADMVDEDDGSLFD